MELRLIPLVHDFTVEPSLISKRVAEALWHYAQGFVRATHAEALVLVDPRNEAMRNWLAERGFSGELVNAYNVEVR